MLRRPKCSKIEVVVPKEEEEEEALTDWFLNEVEMFTAPLLHTYTVTENRFGTE
jgi:hypothetical protein